MHSFRTILASISLFSLLAAPAWASIARSAPDLCLDDSDAQGIATDFGYLISSFSLNITYSEILSNNTLTVDLHDWSDSVRALESGGCTSGPQPLDENRAQFNADQLTIPPLTLEVLQVWHSCDTITFRWYSPQTPNNVTGIVLLETVPNPIDSSPKRIVKTVYSEFNSVAWLVNTGALVPSNCTEPAF